MCLSSLTLSQLSYHGLMLVGSQLQILRFSIVAWRSTFSGAEPCMQQQQRHNNRWAEATWVPKIKLVLKNKQMDEKVLKDQQNVKMKDFLFPDMFTFISSRTIFSWCLIIIISTIRWINFQFFEFISILWIHFHYLD